MLLGKWSVGGVESVVFNYYREIDPSLFQFDFFYDADSTVEPPIDLIKKGARFIKVSPYQSLNHYISELRSHFRREHYCIVHSHLNTLSVFPLYAAWKEGVQIRIAHNHSVPGGNDYFRNTVKIFLRAFSKLFATDYFACSEKAGKWMFGEKIFESGNVFVMKNAIDFLLFSNHDIDNSIKLKKELNLENYFVVGHVGRFTFAKNHLFLLDIFCEILKVLPRAKLLLVGDGELHGKILKKITDLGIQDNVVLTGEVPNPHLYYSLMDVLVLPSVFEGLSMTTVESQAAMKNIVISRAIPQEAVFSNACHYMDDYSSAEDWAKQVIKASTNKIVFSEQKKAYFIKDATKALERKYLSLLNKENQ